MNRVLKRYPVAKFRQDLKRIVQRIELIGGAAIITNHGNDGPVLVSLDLLTMDKDGAAREFILLRQQYRKLKMIPDPKGTAEIDLDEQSSASPRSGAPMSGGKSAPAKRSRRPRVTTRQPR